MDDPRGNEAFDRELRQALAGRGGAAPAPHLDAEIAAAWMDQQLDAAAARSIETHLAGCSDCQVLIATLARLTPEAPAPGVTWWRRLRAGWVIPATVAAAAGLVIWVALPQRREVTPPAESLQASADRAPATNQPVQPFDRKESPATPQAAARSAPPAEAEVDRLSKSREAPSRVAAAPPPSPEPAPTAAPTVAPAPAAPAERRDQLADASAGTRAAPEAKAESADKVAIATEGAAPRQEAAASERRQSLNETITTATRGALATLRQNGSVVWVASDGAARWRTAGARIEFAPRADARFVAASLPVGADMLADASAPGGTVCWMVGRAGTVLVTADGTRFARTTAPTPANLVSVTATDARTAIVTADDGRRFRTADQGATWSALP